MASASARLMAQAPCQVLKNLRVNASHASHQPRAEWRNALGCPWQFHPLHLLCTSMPVSNPSGVLLLKLIEQFAIAARQLHVSFTLSRTPPRRFVQPLRGDDLEHHRIVHFLRRWRTCGAFCNKQSATELIIIDSAKADSPTRGQPRRQGIVLCDRVDGLSTAPSCRPSLAAAACDIDIRRPIP